MTLPPIPLTEAHRRMKQIRAFAHNAGLVVLTGHDNLALIVFDVECGLRLFFGMEQLTQVLMVDNLADAARAIRAADAIG